MIEITHNGVLVHISSNFLSRDRTLKLRIGHSVGIYTKEINKGCKSGLGLLFC